MLGTEREGTEARLREHQDQVTAIQITLKGLLEGELGKVMCAVHQGRDEKPFPKQQRVKAEEVGTTTRMNIVNRINKASSVRRINRVVKENEVKKRRRQGGW